MAIHQNKLLDLGTLKLKMSWQNLDADEQNSE